MEKSCWFAALLLLLALCFSAVLSQADGVGNRRRSEVFREEGELLWCCLTGEELAKCEAFARATERDQLKSDYTFGSYYRPIKYASIENHPPVTVPST